MTLPSAHTLPDDSESPPSKRQKYVAQQASHSLDATHSEALVRRHPLGIRPSGNALTATSSLKTACGRLAVLPDETLMLLFEVLTATELLRLGGTCKALHAYTRCEELWRALFVESSPSSFTWQGTWRSTFLDQPVSHEPHVDCTNLFSDVLHRPFFCAHVPLETYTENIPVQNAITRIPDLTPAAFAADWATQPFILTSPIKQWPIYKQQWTPAHLAKAHGATAFRAESVDWPLETYMSYMRNTHDESPLYLFDRAFAEKMSLHVASHPPDNSNTAIEEQLAAYWPPACFGKDFFTLLGASRPDHRWLIVGPARSGSTFHQDPNGTSAWNAVLSGKKYWIAFPPSSPPPGVYVSPDGSEVTSPLSIAEWLLVFHAEARRARGCREGVCNAGEVLHVPGGWFHLVLNLEAGVAVTQNFVPRARLAAVLRFLRDEKGSISGFKDGVGDPFGLFVDALREYDAELLADVMVEVDGENGQVGKWERLTKGNEDGGAEGGFSFGFGGAEDDDDEDVGVVP